MWEYMSRRARECAEYILQTGATVRECANHLGISKSTVHKLCGIARRIRCDGVLTAEIQLARGLVA